jgi:hypothetical protein
MLGALSSLRPSLRGLAGAAVVVTGFVVVSYLPPGLLLPSLAAAAVGLGLYAALLAVVRPAGLLSSWRYLRGLA